MNLKKFIAAILVCGILISVASAADGSIDNSAQCAILIEADTGRVLYEKNPDEPNLIASTTKIMTALIVIENCDMDAIVEIKPEYTGIEGSSVYLQEGEKLTVKELLYCMLLKSGNDAATALACYTAGSIEAFAELMNEKVTQLNLKNTCFENPHGLDGDNQYSSARDLALITAEAMKHEVFCEIVATESITIGQRYLTNHNKMLKFYDGATGVKTGYTKQAGRTLVTSAERDGTRLIVVTLNDPNDWADHTALLDYGFEMYETVSLCSEGEVIAELQVIGGIEESVVVQAATDCTLTLAQDESVTSKVYLPPFVYAQVERGAAAGKICWYINGEKISETMLVYAHSIERGDEREYTLWEKIKRLF